MIWAACLLLAGSVSAPGLWPRIETSFELPALAGNPFDCVANDVQVTWTAADGSTRRVPAFFDGGTTWRARLAPDAAGTWQVGAVTHNGAPLTVAAIPAQFAVTGEPGLGYGRVRDDARGLLRGDEPYLPLGCNVGWSNQSGTVPEHLTRLAEAGCNWGRVWMAAFARANLDWVYPWAEETAPPLGELSLEVAATWDQIIETAEAHGIGLQVVLQHHGQYSTSNDNNWIENPWNVELGGWLARPHDFFTDDQARALTRAKYRYIIARWGYSPAVLAWELFNEVQFTNAVWDGQVADVAAWHEEMAAWIRAQDPQGHMVVTSSDLDLPIYGSMDYLQPHRYQDDAVAAVDTHELLARDWPQPMFLGEVGSRGDLGADDGTWLQRALWAGLTSDLAAPPQYWAWDTVARNNLYPKFAAARRIIDDSGLVAQTDARRLPVAVDSDQRAPLVFTPGAGWDSAATTFEIAPDGTIDGLANMAEFLHGDYHRATGPEGRFTVTLPEPATFTLAYNSIARSGAGPRILVDGAVVASADHPAADGDQRGSWELSAPVPAGRHEIVVRNDGQDWLVIAALRLDPYVPALGARAKGTDDWALLWFENLRGTGEVSGEVTLAGMADGAYRVHWRDPATGEVAAPEAQVVARDGQLRLTTPPVAHDLAAWVEH